MGKGNNSGDKGNERFWGREITVGIRGMGDCGKLENKSGN